MATLTIRGLPEDVRARLRVRAARNGRSMEAEVREILTSAVADDHPEQDLATRTRARFAKYDDLDLRFDRLGRGEGLRPAELDQ